MSDIPLPTTRDSASQNAWIAAQMAAWQAAWHGLYRQDAALAASGEYDPDASASDVKSDFNLIFGFTWLSPDTRRACLSLLPRGGEICDRVEAHLAPAPPALTEAEATRKARELGDALRAARVHPDTNRAAFDQVGQGGSGEPLSFLFEGLDPDPYAPETLPAHAAHVFLTEPLYAAAGNYYELADWATALLFDPARDRCLGLGYALWSGGWQVSVGDEALLLRRV